ncbi:MAG: NADH dehydrogenase [Gammaproteobacteria bacterium RIFCSPHIGHO2_12_FULL_41_15]|nr:MAG: NADH dehydrogenase [Gammaproteobacteria bacterium RIFCSPHIGHO2_12_FULL_41_15]
MTTTINITDLLSDDSKKQIDHWVSKFPEGRQRSAIIPALRIVQKQNSGSLTNELMEAVAVYLNLPKIAAFEIASFYDMYETQPVGKHKIAVCTNVSCQLRGSDAIVKALEERLGISMGQTSQDQLFTLREVECMACCDGAPMCQLNDEAYITHLTPTSVNQLIDDLIAKEASDD